MVGMVGVRGTSRLMGILLLEQEDGSLDTNGNGRERRVYTTER